MDKVIEKVDDKTINKSIDGSIHKPIWKVKVTHKVSVRNLVEFILRSGDINMDGYGSGQAMLEGTRIHRKIQKEAGDKYKSEVRLSMITEYNDYILEVSGIADGIIATEDGVTIDEIKTVSVPLEYIDESYNPLHWAQAKCYAYIYAAQSHIQHRSEQDNQLSQSCQPDYPDYPDGFDIPNTERISVRLTYYSTETNETKYITKKFSFLELETFFNELIDAYSEWSGFIVNHRMERDDSISKLPFPYEAYRKGQRELAVSVYYAIRDKNKLFARAPTGVGKTISVLFPSLKAMGLGMGEKIFYLTARTTTRQAAEDALNLMIDKGLKFKQVTITSKDKICPLETRSCNPVDCPFAKGHYDRVNDAVLDILRNEEIITREVIITYSRKHMVCPFEYTLDISNWVDCIVCDYNYAFDPRAYLRRYFDEGGDYVLLVDEAHNLVDRAREMFSASLTKSSFLNLKRDKSLKRTAPLLYDLLNKLNKFFIELRKKFDKKYGAMTIGLPADLPTDLSADLSANLSNGLSDGLPSKLSADLSTSLSADLTSNLTNNLYHLIDSFIKECEASLSLCRDARTGNGGAKVQYDDGDNRNASPNNNDALIDLYFECLAFSAVYRLYDERYITYITRADSDVTIKLFCIDPSHLLSRACKKVRTAVFFSATLMPMKYYFDMLGSDETSKVTFLPSPFDRNNMCLMIAGNVSTRYKDRGRSLKTIVNYIKTASGEKVGNYLVFFPSFEYMQSATELYKEYWPEDQIIIQDRSMTENEREDFLLSFKEHPDKTMVGFAVLGGIFSEGIDLVGEKLSGVVVVGVGLPQICDERDIIKDYFNSTNNMGFDYSYRFPGMNRVLQAAGRVIRTEQDRGFVLLIDDRFLQKSYLNIYPEEWSNYIKIFNTESVQKILGEFWGHSC